MGCAGAAPGWLTAAGKLPPTTPAAIGMPCCYRDRQGDVTNVEAGEGGRDLVGIITEETLL